MAYLVDTNVISEIRKRSADPQVLAWQAKQDIVECWVSVLSFAEILNGTERIRRTDVNFARILDTWYQNILLDLYQGRILPVTLEICHIRAKFTSERTLPFADALIAATAKRHGLTLVTRNTKDFQDLGIKLINPWEGPSE